MRKTFTYRQAEYQLAASGTLQEHIQAALAQRGECEQRSEIVETNPNRIRFINYHQTVAPSLCGELMIFTEGNNQPILSRVGRQRVLNIQQIAAAQTGVPNAEFLESILYFCVYGDHIVVAQSTALKVQQLEQHLNWLLHGAQEAPVPIGNHAPVVPLEQYIHLGLQPRAAAGETLPTAKSLTIKRAVESRAETEGAPDREVVRMRPTGKVWGAIEEFLLASGLFQRTALDGFAFEQAFRAGDLTATLELSCLRHPQTGETPVVGQLVSSLANQNDLQWEAELPKVGKVRGNTLIPEKSCEVNTIGTLPRYDDLFPKMNGYLGVLLANPPEFPQPRPRI